MSPDRLLGQAPDFDPHGDIYSLVAVLYEFLTLHHYVKEGPSSDREEMARRIAKNRYVEAKRYSDPVHGAVPPAPGYICKRELRPGSKERFGSAQELHDALQLWVEGRAPVVCPRTFIQSFLCKYGRFVNRFRILAPALTFIGVAMVVASLAFSLYHLAR
jgi:hypothetical protein